MRNRRAATRFTLRRMARKGQITREQAKFILSDDDATEMVADFVQDGIDEAEPFGDDDDSPIIKFITWMIEHQAEIAAFIKMLIALFETDG